jgi:hypothetical protein
MPARKYASLSVTARMLKSHACCRRPNAKQLAAIPARHARSKYPLARAASAATPFPAL